MNTEDKSSKYKFLTLMVAIICGTVLVTQTINYLERKEERQKDKSVTFQIVEEPTGFRASPENVYAEEITPAAAIRATASKPSSLEYIGQWPALVEKDPMVVYKELTDFINRVRLVPDQLKKEGCEVTITSERMLIRLPRTEFNWTEVDVSFDKGSLKIVKVETKDVFERQKFNPVSQIPMEGVETKISFEPSPGHDYFHVFASLNAVGGKPFNLKKSEVVLEFGRHITVLERFVRYVEQKS